MAHYKGITIKFLPLMLLFVVVSICMECGFQFVSAGEIRCLEREREALLKLKQGLIDDRGVLSSWGSEDHKKECCDWDGVWCNHATGHVTGLGLSDGKLRGKISSALLELHHLNNLELSGNDFGGIRIPKFIGSIKSLEQLRLINSNFFGIIPPQLGNLTNLRILSLMDLNIWSENLKWLSHLSLLSRLGLSGSSINDTIWPQHVLNLPSLQKLDLSDCMLTDAKSFAGPLVNSSSTSLFVLDLSFNELTSSTFDWLFNISTNLLEISLSYNQLDGRIRAGFGELIFLESLDLSFNMFEGEIPGFLGNLSLYNLDLSHNQLIGSVPDLAGCPELISLYLKSNKLTGSVPTSLGHLSELEYLDVSYNSLEGTISESHFTKLHNLNELDLSFNSLTLDLSPDWIPPFNLDVIKLAWCKMGPSFPKWLQTQSKFYWLDISFGGISDELPKWLWNLTTFPYSLNFSHNQISGTIPDFSSVFLNYIDVSSNKISGPIPLFPPQISIVQFSQNMFSGSISSLCAIPHAMLALLDLSNNQLARAVPNCWENMTDLMILNLNNNGFSGEIPRALGFLHNLVTLHLGDNNLSGELPSTLKNCRLLQLIDVRGNKLTGNIPSWLGANHTNMMYLSLRQNRFYGDIPLQICNLAQIQILDLSGNSISGKIPHCFNNFTSFVDKNSATTSIIRIPLGVNDYFDYAFVQWKGQESEYKNTLGLLKLIDLSSNKLVGDIPKAFSSLRGLISLNLSRNSLTGNIILDIGEMEMLEILDLSRNRLSGSIPIGLAQLHYLAILDLSNNNLTGQIPLGTQLQLFNASAYAGNNGLCGQPLPLCPNTSVTNEGENTKKKDGGFISLSSLQEFYISLVLGFIVGFWGVVGSLVLKRSWRSAYFDFVDAVGDWLLNPLLQFDVTFQLQLLDQRQKEAPLEKLFCCRKKFL